MRIEAFWAKGYRSLRDVRLEPLGPFNVFYGRNGSGKSNILAAIHTLFQLLQVIGSNTSELEFLRGSQGTDVNEEEARRLANIALEAGVVAHRDLYIQAAGESIALGAILGRGTSMVDLSIGRRLPDSIKVEITLDRIVSEPCLWISQMEIDGRSLADMPLEPDPSGMPSLRHVQALLADRLPSKAFSMVDAIRALGVERDDTTERQESANVLLQDMNEGRLASALFAAKNASVPDLRKRFRTLQTLLEGEPLQRPPFDVLRDVVTKEIAIRERRSTPSGDEREVPLDLAGLGIVQIYTILAKILFAGTSAVGVEEPEAHLHAPTSGLHLRRLLRRLVEERQIEQLFIATHSNLFDLDPDGYFDVSLDEGGATVVRRCPISEVDRHFYEPGPTLHALEELLATAAPDKVMFRRPDGSPVTASEMVEMLRGADPTAVDYLARQLRRDMVVLTVRPGQPFPG
jgi:AAA domain, putative AbiEii toxin, Type IV TA system